MCESGLRLTGEIRFVRDPEMILHLAHFISEDYLKLTGREFEVRALVLTSLNGRKPQLLIDPTVDLSKEPRGYYQRSRIRPLTEPLRKILDDPRPNGSV